MKASLGKTLRKIRKGKQASLDSISDHHLSKSQISRFERGESEISCQRAAISSKIGRAHV